MANALYTNVKITEIKNGFLVEKYFGSKTWESDTLFFPDWNALIEHMGETYVVAKTKPKEND